MFLLALGKLFKLFHRHYKRDNIQFGNFSNFRIKIFWELQKYVKNDCQLLLCLQPAFYQQENVPQINNSPLDK